MNLEEWVKIGVPAIITIIGFIVNFFLTKNSIRKEIENKKANLYLDKLSEIPNKIFQLVELTLEVGKLVNQNEPAEEENEILLKKHNEILGSIICYGTEDAIKIAASMQKYHYNKSENDAGYRALLYPIILLCQVKYDITGIKINPEYWGMMKLTDFKSSKEAFKYTNNELVKELSLDEFLIIK